MDSVTRIEKKYKKIYEKYVTNTDTDIREDSGAGTVASRLLSKLTP